MTEVTFPIYAIIRSKASKLMIMLHGQTFQIIKMTPIYMIINIDVTHRDVLIIDIENVYQEALLQGKKEIILCLKDYINANQIKIDL